MRPALLFGGTMRRAPVFSALLNFGLRARCDMFSSSLAQSEAFRAGKARQYLSDQAEEASS
jgi:hypothetical protein